MRDGIAGLQSVVLYSLPELDGAIDTVPLGGLMGNSIFLVPERVKRLSARLRKWVTLRRTPTHVSSASGLAICSCPPHLSLCFPEPVPTALVLTPDAVRGLPRPNWN
jgi:hypothetical protein